MTSRLTARNLLVGLAVVVLLVPVVLAVLFFLPINEGEVELVEGPTRVEPPKRSAADSEGPSNDTHSPTLARGAVRTLAAVKMAVRINTYLQNGQYGRAWRELHPAHREIADATAFADCWSRRVTPRGQVPGASYKVTEVYDEPWRVSGVGTVPSKAITMQLVTSYRDEGQDVESVVETWTQHAVRAEGRWRWILHPAMYRELKAGC